MQEAAGAFEPEFICYGPPPLDDPWALAGYAALAALGLVFFRGMIWAARRWRQEPTVLVLWQLGWTAAAVAMALLGTYGAGLGGAMAMPLVTLRFPLILLLQAVAELLPERLVILAAIPAWAGYEYLLYRLLRRGIEGEVPLSLGLTEPGAASSPTAPRVVETHGAIPFASSS